MSETNEHLEQAEHAGHGADPFTVRVAMTMAIIAAILAAVALIGHRKHNEALQKQGDSNRLLTQSAGYRVESSNTFAWYQSKRARVDDADKSKTNTKLYAAAPDSDSLRKQAVAKWDDYIKKNKTNPKDIQLDDKGFPAKTADGQDDDSFGALIVKGARFKELAEDKKKEADKADHEYHRAHQQADELDWAHLAVELGLVLCTICILTKKREYWLGGMLAALIGAGLAASSLFMGH